MAAHVLAPSVVQAASWGLSRVAALPGLRVLAWSGDVLYAARAYQLCSADLRENKIEWREVGRFRPTWWRNLSSASHLTFRMVRDGFHALAVLPSGHFVAAVPGAIITLAPGDNEFRVSHTVVRGTRPLHITAVPDGRVFWGEYFDNPYRDEVHIYASEDCGASWEIAYTFPKSAIRHVHNIVYDHWENCLWILTGDNGLECQILRASLDLRNVAAVVSGNQQARAVALVPTRDALYFSSDSPLESNHIYRLGRSETVTAVAELNSSSICGCQVGDAIFFSAMVEPSGVNRDPHVRLYGSLDGVHWPQLLAWKKDRWPSRFFQYGNAFLPDGRNTSSLLALTTIATREGDLETSLWRLVER